MSPTHIDDLPDSVIHHIFGFVAQTRSRNSASLVCRRWYHVERQTRTSLVLRGSSRHLFLLSSCFPSVTHLDLSHLSPWGSSHLPHLPVAIPFLRIAFPRVTSLALYARGVEVIDGVLRQWPGLRRIKLVRWHRRPEGPVGAEIGCVMRLCGEVEYIDLSEFYFWTEDVPAALAQQRPENLTSLNLISLSSVEGFRSPELIFISSACPFLRRLLAPCAFDPRYSDSVGDDALLALAANCTALTTLCLVDHSAVSCPRANSTLSDGFTSQDSLITNVGLNGLFKGLVMLENLVLDVCHNVRDSGPVLECLNNRCKQIASLKLGSFHGICKATALHLDGLAVCGGLLSLSLKNCADLMDSGLVAIGRGCSRLLKFEMHGCNKVTQMGMRKMVGMLRSTLIDVSISGCCHLDAHQSLYALEPIHDRIQRLHIDCVWPMNGQEEMFSGGFNITTHGMDDLNDFEEAANEQHNYHNVFENCYQSQIKKRRLSLEPGMEMANTSEIWSKSWTHLQHLSLWVPVGVVLEPLFVAGLESCPELEEVSIKVEGDCRMCPKPESATFGLGFLTYYSNLVKMKLDCAEVVGYVFTAPMGQMDLSLWERFYLNGIEKLFLHELEYWPPQDKDVNQRSLSLPAVGLLAQCAALRKLFIHGTTHEHFMRFLLNIPGLRDVQLREDYYPAPEDDTSTEMRIDSCSRFEDALNSRQIPD